MSKFTRGAGTVFAAASIAVSVAPDAGAASNATADRDQLAIAALTNIVAGKDDAVVAAMNPAMAAKLSATDLVRAWASYQQQLGSYQSHGSPADVACRFTVVNVPLSMAEQPGQFRITFDSDARIAGLFFLRSGVPVPPCS